MAAAIDLVLVDSRYEGSARCLVCGDQIREGDGVSARYGDRTLRFRCTGCVGRFQVDPERYLAGHDAACCKEDQTSSPASEWRCE